MNHEELHSLLRERARVEMPADYTRSLLNALHQRQRSELLQRSLWRIAAERVQTFWSAHSMSTPVYILAVAALLAVSLAVVALLKPAVDPSAMARLGPVWATPNGFPQDPGQAGGGQDSSRPALETQQVSFGR